MLSAIHFLAISCTIREAGRLQFWFHLVLLTLIKQEAEKRTTRSWDVSINNSVREIKRTNKRRKAGGCYASQDELIETIEEAFEAAIERAALEAFEGRYDGDELVQMIDVTKIKETALTLINC